MIHFVIERSVVRISRNTLGGGLKQWLVEHPSNGAILAYCDSEDEANEVRAALESLGRQFAKLNAL